jgi:hypothetical protein
MTVSWPEQPPSHTPPPRRAQRHKMNRVQRIFTVVVTVLVLLVLGGYLFLRFGPLSVIRPPQLSTTPTCLQQKHPFCAGVALPEVNARDLKNFKSVTGVTPHLVEYYQRFGKPFSKSVANTVAMIGGRPFIQLNPHGVSITDIVRGKYDNYIKSYADSIRNFQLPIVLGFGHEMNGSWASWSLPHTQPATFIAAWRHIVTLVHREGALNVVWAWDISHASHPSQAWWPGSAYVGWVGIDGYLRPGQTFIGQFGRAIKAIQGFAPGKPLLLAETAVAPGHDQIHQIAELFGGARRNHMIGVVWFDVNKKEAWQLTPNSPAVTEFKKVAQ